MAVINNNHPRTYDALTHPPGNLYLKLGPSAPLVAYFVPDEGPRPINALLYLIRIALFVI